jgi:ectoine hydroxylase-related dioxygenase (phytanoyl-CoA dioxygenase family)
MSIRDFSDAEIASYQQHGAAYLPAFADQALVEQLLDVIEDPERSTGRYKNALSQTGKFTEERFLYPEVPGVRDYALNEKIGRNIAKAMNADSTRVLFDHLFHCGANTPVDYYWHQDLSYWPIDGDQVCTIWLVLNDCDVDSGALELVLDSDKGGIYAIRPFGDEDFGEEVKKNYNAESIPKYDQEREKHKFLCHDLKAGDAYLFNAKTMHSSAGNRSQTQERIAYAIRYIGDDVVWHPRPAFDQEALTPQGEPLAVGDKFEGEEFPLIWSNKA